MPEGSNGRPWDDWRLAAAAAMLCALWYAALITRFTFDLTGREAHGTVFNSMLDHLLAGQFDVDPRSIGAEGFRRGGLVYAYFGILPALLRLPLLAVPGAMGIDVTRISTVLAAALGVFLQLRAIAMVHTAAGANRGAAWLLGCLAVGVMLGGPGVQFLRASIYEEVIHWAGAFAALFVCAAVAGLTRPAGFSARILGVMALAAGLALMTRVSTGLGLYAALGLLLLHRSWPGRVAPAIWLRRLLTPVHLMPIAILAAGMAAVLAVNWARWGDPLMVLDIRDHIMNARYPDRLARVLASGEFNPARIWFGTLYYFVPVWWLYRPGGALLFSDYTGRMVETELPPGSFFLSDPLLLLLGGLFLARVWRSRREWGAALALAAGLAAPIVLMLGLVFQNFRYRQEFYPFLTLTALAGVLLIARNEPAPAILRWAWPMAACGVVCAHFFLLLYVRADLGPADVVKVQSLLRSLGL